MLTVFFQLLGMAWDIVQDVLFNCTVTVTSHTGAIYYCTNAVFITVTFTRSIPERLISDVNSSQTWVRHCCLQQERLLANSSTQPPHQCNTRKNTFFVFRTYKVFPTSSHWVRWLTQCYTWPINFAINATNLTAQSSFLMPSQQRSQKLHLRQVTVQKTQQTDFTMLTTDAHSFSSVVAPMVLSVSPVCPGVQQPRAQNSYSMCFTSVFSFFPNILGAHAEAYFSMVDSFCSHLSVWKAVH